MYQTLRSKVQSDWPKGQTARKWESQDWNPGLSPELVRLIPQPPHPTAQACQESQPPFRASPASWYQRALCTEVFPAGPKIPLISSLTSEYRNKDQSPQIGSPLVATIQLPGGYAGRHRLGCNFSIFSPFSLYRISAKQPYSQQTGIKL